jgi:hypothetical protein
MTQQFHEGQEVEVAHTPWGWRSTRKAKIVCLAYLGSENTPTGYKVEFPDGTWDVFDAEHIRAIDPNPANLSRESRRVLQEEWDSVIKKLRDAGALP